MAGITQVPAVFFFPFLLHPQPNDHPNHCRKDPSKIEIKERKESLGQCYCFIQVEQYLNLFGKEFLEKSQNRDAAQVRAVTHTYTFRSW